MDKPEINCCGKMREFCKDNSERGTGLERDDDGTLNLNGRRLLRDDEHRVLPRVTHDLDITTAIWPCDRIPPMSLEHVANIYCKDSCGKVLRFKVETTDGGL